VTEPASLIVRPESWTQHLPLDDLFPAESPVFVDVGCGKGSFLVAHAGAEPAHAFLGVDRLLVRLRKVEKKLRRAGISNTRLLHVEASYGLKNLLPPESITGFFVFFPDPWPKRRHHHRRLFNADFLDTLHLGMKPGGCIHAATDHLEYFENIDKLFSADSRFERIPTFAPSEEERTDFERQFMGQGLQIGRGSYRKRTP